MSVLTIDPQTYNIILQSTIMRYIKRGMKVEQARIHAQALMDSCFVTDTTINLLADELDQKENGIYG
jgi:hypothetical protein